MSNPAIAVIGMGCWYPGAHHLSQLWENILAKRVQFRRIPEQRLPLSEYHDPDPTAPEKTYGTRAAVIDGFEFDWVSKRLPKGTVESADIVHWLALEVALKALEDAGYTRGNVVTERSGVVLGNTLTGEQMRSHMMRLRWPFVQRAMRAAAEARGLPSQLVNELVETTEEYYKSAFQPITEDSLAGCLSNTIAGRICNFLDFNGGGYVVDGACSASLIAVATAATALANNDLDLALAGGVDVSLDPFEIVGFAKMGAITRQDMTVYDRHASGFIPGEGCGFVVLKRLEDARRDGNYVYAVLRGWGISSDGRGGVTAPKREGQAIALLRAYTRAGYSPNDVDFIEGHGTGTPVGDRTELEAIGLVMGSDREESTRSCGITSFKSIVGHTKAAAGVGGFIKAVMAVNRRILPPTAGCKEPNTVFETAARYVYPILQGEVRSKTETLRAGVSAMGFGGINCHVTLESGDSPSSRLETSIEERALLVSQQDTELFVLGAESISALRQRAQAVISIAEGISVGELVDLAAHLAHELDMKSPVRAVVIAETPEELIGTLKQLEKMLDEMPPTKGEVVISPEKNVWIGNTVSRNRIGFLFPGQGSQQLNMGRTLVERHSCARELVEQADCWLGEIGAQAVSQLIFRPLDRTFDLKQIEEWSATLAQTEVAQPAICLASLLWTRKLANLGIKPVAVAGHSLGELTAFRVAGAFDDKALLSLAAVRGQAMSAPANDAGTMVSLACSQQTAVELLKQVSGYAVVANINSPKQVVISGERTSIQEVIELAAAHEIRTYQLPVSNAFHSQLVSAAAEHLKKCAPVPELLGETDVQLFSSVDGQQVKRGLKLREHFAHQVLAQVNFIASVKKLAQECDLLIEVGPGKVLSNLVKDITEPSGPVCLPIESKPGLDRDLNTVLASLFVHGGEIRWEALYENRLVRPFVPASDRIFIENPCAQPFKVSAVTPSFTLPTSGGWVKSMPNEPSDATNVSPQVVSQALFNYLTHRGKFLAEVIRADLQTLPLLPVPDNNGVTIQESRVPTAPIANEPKPKTTVEAPRNFNKTEAIEELLIDQVVQRTGYPRESITLQARLLDDLNLDSIKAGELVATVAKECGIAGEVDPSSLANATLQAVAQVIRAVIANKKADVEAIAPKLQVPSQAPKASVTIPNLLLELVEQRTGFPRATLSLDLRLLSDLNLDSIKAGEFVAEAAKSAGVAGRLDPSKFANATLTEVADALEQLFQEGSILNQPQQLGLSTPNTTNGKAIPASKPTSLTSLEEKSWARNFIVQYVAQEAQATRTASQQNQWQTANVLILCTPNQASVAEALYQDLQSRGARVQIKPFAEAQEQLLTSSVNFSHLIAVLPQVPTDQLSANVSLQESIKRLHTAAALTPVSSKSRQPMTLAFIQFGGGYFGKQPQIANIEQCCATAFAGSIHFERPDLKVRAIDFSCDVNLAALAERVSNELSTPETYVAAGYDSELTRRIPRPVLQHPKSYQRRAISWSSDDVILVTGGAKGITATCALAFAQATGARMALVGSSPYQQGAGEQGNSNELVSTLESFRNAGLTCRYYHCDVTDAQAVTALIHQIRQEMGKITGVIHGAGLNKPRRVEQVSAEAARAEVAPKLVGALNLCNALKDNPPKLFVGFASLIGIIGVPGNAWYAFSNEALDLILRRFEAEHPETSVLSIAFTVWEEVGMGARMGSIPALVKLGLYSISKEEGVRRFLNLMLNDPGERQVAVAGRVKVDTWLPALPPLPAASRFLEQLLYVEPGVEVVSRVHLSIEQDLYVQDHVYKGSYLFPTVFGLEAMAQVVAYAIGQSHFQALRIEDIRLERPIVVDPTKGVDIEIHAEVIEDWSFGAKQRVRAGIRTEQTGFAMDHFSATFVLNIDSDVPKATVELPETPLDIQPQQDLYSWLLFQGPRFQRLQQVYTLNANQCVFSTEMRSSSSTGQDSFADRISTPLLLGDPFFRDSLLQVVQLVIPQDISLPIRIDSIELYRPNGDVSNKCIGVAILEGRSDRQYRSTVFALDEDGRVIERLEGYQLRILEHREDHPTAEELADPSQRDEQILRSKLARWAHDFKIIVPEVSLAHLPGLHGLSAAERHQREVPIFSKAIAKLLNPGNS